MTTIKADETKISRAGPGRPSSGLAPSKRDLLRLYVRGGQSIREVAEALGVSKDMVYRALREYGIERRSHTWGPRLEKYDLEFLKELVRRDGFRQGAINLGVDKSTLFRYLKKARK